MQYRVTTEGNDNVLSFSALNFDGTWAYLPVRSCACRAELWGASSSLQERQCKAGHASWDWARIYVDAQNAGMPLSGHSEMSFIRALN